jgi:hypothetical protein
MVAIDAIPLRKHYSRQRASIDQVDDGEYQRPLQLYSQAAALIAVSDFCQSSNNHTLNGSSTVDRWSVNSFERAHMSSGDTGTA